MADPRIPPGAKPGDFIPNVGTVSPQFEIIPEGTGDELVVVASVTEGSCKLKRDEKTDKNKKKPGDSSFTDSIRELTQSLTAENDCDALQLKVKTALSSLQDDLEDKLNLTDKKLSEVLPITKIPTNPLKIPSWLKKFTVGRVLPDLDSVVELIKKITEVTSALSELISVLDKVNPNLDACLEKTFESVKRDIKDEIKNQVYQLQSSIAKTIAEAICEGLNALDITADDLENIKDARRAISDLKLEFEQLKNVTDQALGSKIARIGQNQAVLQELTGLPPVLDTSSLDTFLETAASPEYEQYKESVGGILSTPEPVISTAPSITGNTTVGSTLLCSNGIWEANGSTLTYEFQWYRNGAEIYEANTFSYTVSVDDLESKLYCMVTAQNNVNIEQAQSAETNTITFALTGGNKPTITGTASNNSTLSCSTGTWPFTPTIIQYEWIRGTSTVVKSLSANNLYTVVSADVGSTIKCKVVAQSFKYTLSDTTDPTATVI